MSSQAAVSKADVAELENCSVRTVERREYPIVDVRPARNGRTQPMFGLDALSIEARTKWVERNSPSLDVNLVLGPSFSDQDRDQAAFRFNAIEPLIFPGKHRELWEAAGGTQEALIQALAGPDKSARSLKRWLERFRNGGGLPGLVDRDRADKGKLIAVNGAALELIHGLRLQFGKHSVRDVFRAYEEARIWLAANIGRRLVGPDAAQYAHFRDPQGLLGEAARLPQVSYETVRRICKRIPEPLLVLAADGEQAFHNSQELISYRSFTDLKPLDYVVMDHRRLDIFCLIPARGGWKLARPWLTAALDMRTRKWLAWAVVENPSSDSIAAVLRRVFLQHGLPKACYWDNGKDFVCEYLEGRELRRSTAPAIGEMGTEWRGVMGTLGVRVHHAIVRRARAKIIEPCFLAISHFDRTLLEWCGHKPGARPERFGTLLEEHEAWTRGERQTTPFRTIGEVAGLYSAFLEADLNERPHQGEGMQKVTPTGRGWWCPNEAWEILIRGVERRSISLETLAFAFQRRKEIKVQHGEVRTTIDGAVYHYRLVGHPIGLMVFNGRTVQLAYDPLDPSSGVLYCDDQLVGLVFAAPLRRMGQDDGFVQDERDRRFARREVRKYLEGVQRAVPVATVEERLARRLAVQPVRVDPERPQIEAPVSPALAEAVEAARTQREFSFCAAEPLIESVPTETLEGDEDEFKFFG